MRAGKNWNRQAKPDWRQDKAVRLYDLFGKSRSPESAKYASNTHRLVHILNLLAPSFYTQSLGT